MRKGLELGLDIVGADTFVGHYESWLEEVDPQVREKISVFSDILPFEAGHFDVVIANLVFEHIPDLAPALSEIARVLRPGGHLIAAFPVLETWHEGHVGLYFAHRLSSVPRLRLHYLKLAHTLGHGLYRAPGQSAAEWAQSSADTLDKACVFHRKAHALSLIEKALGHSPVDISSDYIDLQIRNSRFRPLAPVLANAPGRLLKRAVAGIRAGLVVSAKKA